MAARLEALRAKNPSAELKYRWVDYDRISVHLKRAVVSAEDAKFIDHEGFDWEGIQRALEKNQNRGKVVAGGSTISQQLAKNLLLSGERSYLRRSEEHTSELQSLRHLVCRLLLEKKKKAGSHCDDGHRRV